MGMIPDHFLAMYLGANLFALLVLALSVWRRHAARWVGAAVFLWAAVINSYTAISTPLVYVDYAALTPSPFYRDFINGWFSAHVQFVVLPIAAGQLAISLLLASRRTSARRLGVLGALLFLLAIAPLGVGSGFPFSLTFGTALAMSVREDPVRLRTSVR